MIVGNVLILLLAAALATADAMHSRYHGRNLTPREYYDPHEMIRAAP